MLEVYHHGLYTEMSKSVKVGLTGTGADELFVIMENGIHIYNLKNFKTLN